jgi:Fic family protein
MADVIAFLRRDDLDPITMAAIAHAQFETIHPFADGNGRIGRVLIGWTLATGLDVATPPPVSTAFARDIGGYLSGLTLYRQGSVDHWVRWFANAVLDAAHRSDAVFDGVDDVIRRWRTQTGSLRSDAAARRLIDELVRRPVIDVATAAQLLDVSRVTARSAIQVLAAEGILTEQDVPPTKHGRPGTWWAATDLLALLGG